MAVEVEAVEVEVVEVEVVEAAEAAEIQFHVMVSLVVV
jgi:hypothetical protein